MESMDQMQALGMGSLSMLATMMGGQYIAPPAGQEGGPPGYNPDLPAAEVIVDPDVFGQGAVIRPREVTQELMQRVMHGKLKSNQQLHEVRVAASDAMKELADLQSASPRSDVSQDRMGTFSPIVIDVGRSEGSQPIPLSGQNLVPEAPEVKLRDRKKSPQAGVEKMAEVSVPTQLTVSPVRAAPAGAGRGDEIPDWQTAPASIPRSLPILEDGQPPPSSFPAAVHGGLRRHIAAPAPPAPPALGLPEVRPPSVCVDFEIDGNPFPYQGWYHRAIRNKHTIVLIFDDRLQGYPRVFPPMTDTPMLMHIRGQDKMFEVISAGHRFVFEVVPGLKYEMDLLLITKEHDAPPGEA